ncbi:hypothetical protein [Hydrogenophaga luteola]|uniref:DUF2283 domain-containing protein n=1 Tax=Hydrogenophaga luteola TaxID=1591122 RepID=A0ABV7W9G7_9BURK
MPPPTRPNVCPTAGELQLAHVAFRSDEPALTVIELDVPDDGVALDLHYDTDRAAPMGDQF